jgi:hypothetical protein
MSRPTDPPLQPAAIAAPGTLQVADFGVVLEKLKLLQFGLFGLQQYGRNAPLDVDDLGPFYRLAEEIESNLLELTRRLPPEPPEDSGA